MVVYSIVDRKSFKAAERVLHYLRDNDCLLTRGAILVGNKTDLERQREVPVQLGKKLAKEIHSCKFIETSSGIDHNVDELLVGIVAQVKLNPQRIHRLSEKQKLMLAAQQQTGPHFGPNKFKSSTGTSDKDHCEDGDEAEVSKNGKLARKRQGGHSTGPLNSLDLHSLKRSVKLTKEGKKKQQQQQANAKDTSPRRTNQDLKEEDEDNKSTSSTSSSSASLCSSRSLKSSRSTGSLDREMSNFKSRMGSTNSTPIRQRGRDGRDAAGHHSRRATTDGEMDDEIGRDEEEVVGGTSKSAKSSPVKFTNRTKMFLTSFLKFRKSLRMRRRSSSSCSDFFVI